MPVFSAFGRPFPQSGKPPFFNRSRSRHKYTAADLFPKCRANLHCLDGFLLLLLSDGLPAQRTLSHDPPPLPAFPAALYGLPCRPVRRCRGRTPPPAGRGQPPNAAIPRKRLAGHGTGTRGSRGKRRLYFDRRRNLPSRRHRGRAGKRDLPRPQRAAVAQGAAVRRPLLQTAAAQARADSFGRCAAKTGRRGFPSGGEQFSDGLGSRTRQPPPAARSGAVLCRRQPKQRVRRRV